MRIGFFILLILIVALVPWWLFGVCALGYMFRFMLPFELLVLGVLIDSYFGTAQSIPLYSLMVLSMLVFVEWIRPRLTFYTRA